MFYSSAIKTFFVLQSFAYLFKIFFFVQCFSLMFDFNLRQSNFATLISSPPACHLNTSVGAIPALRLVHYYILIWCCTRSGSRLRSDRAICWSARQSGLGLAPSVFFPSVTGESESTVRDESSSAEELVYLTQEESEDTPEEGGVPSAGKKNQVLKAREPTAGPSSTVSLARSCSLSAERSIESRKVQEHALESCSRKRTFKKEREPLIEERERAPERPNQEDVPCSLAIVIIGGAEIWTTLVLIPDGDEERYSRRQQAGRVHRLNRAHYYCPCTKCGQPGHTVLRCPDLAPIERYEMALGLRVCHVCLIPWHDTWKCYSKYRRTQCGDKHNVVLSLEPQQGQRSRRPPPGLGGDLREYIGGGNDQHRSHQLPSGPTSGHVMTTGEDYDLQHCLTVKITRVKPAQLVGVLDTGSTVNLIPSRMATALAQEAIQLTYC